MKKDNIKISTVLAFAVLFGILLMSILAPWLAPYDPLKIDMKNALLPPSKLHLLGTDNIGRDILSRVIYGGRQSIVLAAIATSMSMALGCIIGMIAGYFGSWVDVAITSISNIFQGLPGMTMMIAIAGLMGSGVTSMMLALVITSWVGFSRIVRGEVMKIKKEYFIEGLRSFGVGHMRILFYHVMPNLISSIIIIFATRIASSILSVASLSFLGLGLEPPTPDWGVMISDARMYYRTSPMLVIAPGVCIVLFSLCVNIIADWLRDRLDVRRDSVKE
jgi:peptide/nickel transport system permease protein